MAEAKGRAALGISAEDQTGPGTKSAIKNMNRVTQEAEKAQSRMSASSQKGRNRFGRAAAELSRGVEDFGQQLSVSFDMAVRASANNLTQFAHVLGPIAGTLTSIGIAAYFAGPAIASLFTGGDPTMSGEEFNEMLSTTLDNFRRTRDIERFKRSLKGMSADRRADEISRLTEELITLEDEIRVLEADVQKSMRGIEESMTPDLSTISSLTAAQLRELREQEKRIRDAILQEKQPAYFGGPLAGFAPPDPLRASERKRRIAELEKELDRLREKFGLESDIPLTKLLEEYERLKAAGVDVSRIEAEIKKRRDQIVDTQKKINAAKKAEVELTKRLADQMQLIAAIQPRTQKFVELLARTQLRGDALTQPAPPALPEVPDAPAAPAEPAVPGEDPFSEFLRPDRGALFFGNEGRDLENFDDIFNEGLGALKQDAAGADAARNDLLKKNNELAQDIIDAVEDSSRMRAKIVSF